MPTAVESHYRVSELGDAILRALAEDGKDLERLTVEDLAPVDGFHIRGREATRELIGRTGPVDGLSVLDVGCGVGGAARHLVAEHGCEVTGIDATEAYVHAAAMLSERVGLADRTTFYYGSALELPFEYGSFDVAWTEHVQMNIADKHLFYSELARVVKPGGRILFHDVFQGEGGPIHLPVPWASKASISHLAKPEAVRQILKTLGLVEEAWVDVTDAARDWMGARIGSKAARPNTGLHLLMGETTPTKFGNLHRNLAENRIAVVQAVWAKPRTA